MWLVYFLTQAPLNGMPQGFASKKGSFWCKEIHAKFQPYILKSPGV